MYSKRWELIHILGGGCAECGNQNFYELEIDHKYNDGDGERVYYTNFEVRYTNNPKRARQRLQILCKECHNDKHTPIPKPTQAQKNREIIRLFIDTLKSLETTNCVPVPQEILCKSFADKASVDIDYAYNYLRIMLRQATIYESKPEHYNTV